MREIKYLSLFSGIGAFERALQNDCISYELVGYSEIDRFASKAYSLLHHVPESANLGDITRIDETSLPSDIDLITYGFPCQDISIAGEKKGFSDTQGNKTRSGLFFDALRIINHCRPKIAVAENVANLTGKKMTDVFETVLSGLDAAGYNNYWQILDAKDYGIPQSRKRVFIVSIRKDIDTKHFEFPKKISLKTCMGDFLEDTVDESFYLSDERTKTVIRHDSKHKGHIADRGGICPTLLARDFKDPKVVFV